MHDTPANWLAFAGTLSIVDLSAQSPVVSDSMIAWSGLEVDDRSAPVATQRSLPTVVHDTLTSEVLLPLALPPGLGLETIDQSSPS